ncbi:hypothetical protein AVEN_237166-1 [Araneus ventricosus]|uniref:Mutator-like transposase domain-containing protein n=1 Tax=Araneus ventricosus TaxID=182803 RepID=A0A4Y2LCC2_ARAVE|nr:hypothetical protein AVEN_237166-1 [Araneus ventricosus]
MLEDTEWLSDFAFFTDLLCHMNNLNVKMQGKNQFIDDIWAHLKAFKLKLNLFSGQLAKNDLSHFSRLNSIPSVHEEKLKFNLFINHFKMPKARSKKFKKRSFHGNRHRNSVPKNNVSTASATKLNTLKSSDGLEYDFQELKGNRIIDIQTLLGVFSILSCPKCFATGLKLTEDSKEGLCSNFARVCKCGFMAGFTTTPKEYKKCSLNTLLVFGLRLMGRGFSAGMKLLCTLNLPYVCKKTFRIHELKLLEAVKYSCEENMKAASKEVQNFKKTTTCGVSVDGTWQRRGHMSLNGCVSVISIDTGKILDLEVMTQYCKMCEMNIKCDHECSNYKGSSGNMESVGAFRIFERSVMKRELQYTEYYGDGDSKAFLKVKDIYGEDTVTKLECIGPCTKKSRLTA